MRKTWQPPVWEVVLFGFVKRRVERAAFSSWQPCGRKTNRSAAFDVLLFVSWGLFVGDSDSELRAEPKQRQSRAERLQQ